jgi:hypothetical protein
VEFETTVNYPVGHARDTRCEPDDDDEQGRGRTRQTAREQLSNRFSRRACVALVAEHRAGYTPVAAAGVLSNALRCRQRVNATLRACRASATASLPLHRVGRTSQVFRSPARAAARHERSAATNAIASGAARRARTTARGLETYVPLRSVPGWTRGCGARVLVGWAVAAFSTRLGRVSSPADRPRNLARQTERRRRAGGRPRSFGAAIRGRVATSFTRV